VADVDDEEEGRGGLVGGEVGEVEFTLGAGLEHLAVPGGGVAADAGLFLTLLGGGEGRGGGGVGGGGGVVLFGFEDEAAAPVEIDELGGGGAGGGVGDGDGALEDVGVFRVVGDGGVGLREVEEGAELLEEGDVVGALGEGGGGPASDEGGDGGGGGGVGRTWGGGRGELRVGCGHA
jgi:hypothetical protein